MSKTMVRASFIIFLLTITSKIAAFIITIVFSHYFGADTLTDAYYAAGTIPNLVNNSLTICALTLFIPVYIKCKCESGEKRANEFTSNVINSFVIFNIVMFISVCITSETLAKLVAPGFTYEGLMHTRWMICLLSMSFPFTVAIYVINNLCNANQKYVLPAALILFNNIFVLFFCIGLAPVFGIYIYPLICTSAWIFQLIISYTFINGKIFKYKCVINIRDNYFLYMLKQSIPVMFATAADQINLAADNIISSDLPGGSLSCLGYAHRIFNSINGVVASTLLTVYYPIISKQYAEKDRHGLDVSIRRYLEIMLMLTLPTTMIIQHISADMTCLLFGNGAMKSDDIRKISLIVIIYICGLLFMSLKEFATRLFYVIGDTKSPTIINSGCVVINICLSLVFKDFWGVYGIAIATLLATIICAVVEVLILLQKSGGIYSIAKRNIIIRRNIIQILSSCFCAMLFLDILKTFFVIENVLCNILVSICIYVIVALCLLLILRNEYAVILQRKVERYFISASK